MSVTGPQRKDSGYVIEFAIKCENDIPRNWRLKDRSQAIAARRDIMDVMAKYAFREARNQSKGRTKSADQGHHNRKTRQQTAMQKILHP